ncbi:MULTISPECIES: heavy metal translocating P-type ATPase [Mesorhizobium]|uniref:heavy metal translocating P-type ATPase n=2 Tax=Phyllobacteriaceae TaxID=69277 RepID=UPI0010A95E12|nr:MULTISPECIES: cation-translocating P-type ATPase [Mesorhizobium]
MASQDTTHRQTLVDSAEARGIAPTAAPRRNDHDLHEHDHEDHEHGHDHDHPFEWAEAVRIAVVAITAAAVWFGVWEPFPAVSVIGVVGLLIGGWPILREAFENVVERRMTMELSMTIAIAAAAAIGEFFTALVITLFVLVAEVLEGLTVGRGRKAIRDLLEFLPREVSVRRSGSIRSVAAEELSLGDAILVAPGGRIPVDGAVLSGHSFVDESRITGESMPVEKTAGTQVFAGSINQSGALEVTAERIGRDTSYGKIIEAVERAEKSRAPVQRLADRLAGYLVYFALGAAVLTFLITRDVYSTISVIIVAGACGIAAGTPLAILGGIGRSARLGAIVKGGVHLETLGKVDTVVLDKTGTLTFGRPEVQQLLPSPDTTDDELLDAAASAELRSEHPLGRAIVSYARSQGRKIVEPTSFAYTPGRGIATRIGESTVLVGNRAWMAENGIGMPASDHDVAAGSEVFAARDGRLLGSLAVADTVRPEAKRAVEALHRLGIRTVLLTGDARHVAAAVGGALGIKEIEAELLPEDKLKRIQALVAQKRVVAMVGDGVNDAPALAEASVGVAMGSGTDVAQESADVVLLGNDLARFVETLAVARRTRGIIWQNFAGTIGVDALGIVLAAFGFLNPLLAAAIHVVSELVFILNSARLLPTPEKTVTAKPELIPELAKV